MARRSLRSRSSANSRASSEFGEAASPARNYTWAAGADGPLTPQGEISPCPRSLRRRKLGCNAEITSQQRCGDLSRACSTCVVQLLHFARLCDALYIGKGSGTFSDVACTGGVSPVRLKPSTSAPTAGIAALSYNRISSVVLPSPSGSTGAACAQL